jgi:hypothetical protein
MPFTFAKSKWFTEARFLKVALGVAVQLYNGSSAAETDTQVTLPPLIVESSTDPAWLYVEAPGFVVLSQLPQEATKRFVRDYYRYHEMLSIVLPPDLRAKYDVPERVILYADRTKSIPVNILREEMLSLGVAKNEKVRVAASLAMRDNEVQALLVVLPEITSREGESYDSRSSIPSQYSVLEPSVNARKAIRLSSLDIEALITLRSPHLPEWFISGFVSFYDRIRFTSDSIIADPLIWRSLEETKSITDKKSKVTKMLSLRKIFERKKETFAVDEKEIWNSEVELFVRWCFDGRSKGRIDSLRRFVSEISNGVAPNEEEFLKCFRSSESVALEGMGDMLVGAVKKSTEIMVEEATKPLPLKPHLANLDEITLLKGDLQKLEIDFVRKRIPALAPKFSQQAKHTIMDSYIGASREPNVAGLMGLYEYEIGEFVVAKELLGVAAGAHIIRPRVYLELAKLLLKDSTKREEIDKSHIDRETALRVEALLKVGREQMPAQIDNYLTLCWLYQLVGSSINSEQWGILGEGIREFPLDYALLYDVASLRISCGYTSEANALIERSLNLDLDAAQRASFLQLKALNSVEHNNSEIRR